MTTINYRGKHYLFRNVWDYWAFAEVVLADVYRSFKLQNDDVVLDLGANIGLFTIHVADKVKRVISVEPEPSNFAILNQAIRENRLENVTALNMAISDKKEIIRIEGLSTLAHVSNTGTPIEADSLNSILEQTGASVIKMDIEGFEGTVLRAFTGWDKIREMIIEFHSPELREEITAMLATHGFTIKDITAIDEDRIKWEIRTHLGDFIKAELKNRCFLTWKVLKYYLKIGPPGGRPRPGAGNAAIGASVVYAYRNLS